VGAEESSQDVRRSALRAIDAIARGVPDARSVRAFAELFERVTKRDPVLAGLYAQVAADAGK